jgi:hypothetical protein
MPKSTNLTSGVFGNIVGNSSYDKFIQQDDSNDKNLARCKELYARIVDKNRDDFETLGKLEEIITQLRCKIISEKNFKLSQVRGYIYARTPFYRNGRNIKDIRVVVGKTSEYGENLDALFELPSFVSQAKIKLMIAMNIEITSNMIFINKIEKKYVTECVSNT